MCASKFGEVPSVSRPSPAPIAPAFDELVPEKVMDVTLASTGLAASAHIKYEWQGECLPCKEAAIQ